MKKKVLSILFSSALLLGGLSLGTQYANAQNTLTQAGDECPTGGAPNKNCPYWNVTVTFGFPVPTMSCTTGGEFTCKTN